MTSLSTTLDHMVRKFATRAPLDEQDKLALLDLPRSVFMPRFFFHLYNDVTSRDEEGKDLPDQSAAHHQALAYARDMAAVTVREGYLTLSHRIEVTDHEGGLVLELPFRNAVHIKD